MDSAYLMEGKGDGRRLLGRVGRVWGGGRVWLRCENGHSSCPKGFGVGVRLVERLWGVGSDEWGLLSRGTERDAVPCLNGNIMDAVILLY